MTTNNDLSASQIYDLMLNELNRDVSRAVPISSPMHAEAVQENQHIAQVASYPNTSITARDIRVRPLSTLERVLLPCATSVQYRRRADERKTVNHWGQRKLLLSEIEFLTLHAKPHDTVVYAGAAPGTHTEYLASLFPTLKFVLVDPADFVAKHNPPQIEVRQGFFTDAMALEFANRTDVLFVCDVRTADWKVMDEEAVESAVEGDQMMQMKWHVLMKPRVSMLKFRLPWGDGETQYLDGRIYLPIWGPQTTTETRLFVERDAKLRAYSHKKYEAQMFAFNVNDRVNVYARTRDLVECEGLCRCYDCSAELLVVLRYFCAYRTHEFLTPGTKAINKSLLWASISDFIRGLARKCSPQSGRQLYSVVNSETRRSAWFGGRRFDTAEQKIVNIDDATTRRGVEDKKRNRDGFERKSRSVTAETLGSDPALASIVESSKRIRLQRANEVAPTTDEDYATLLKDFAKNT
jgi:hypothetical protein